MEEEAKVVTDFIRTLSQPEETLLPLLWSNHQNNASASRSRQEQQQQQLRRTCQFLFQEIERLSTIYHSLKMTKNDCEIAPKTSLSGLDSLYTGTEDDHPVDAETLWGQVEMQNAALQSLLKKSLKRVGRSVEQAGKDEVRLLDLGGVLSEEEEDGKEEISSDGSQQDEESSSSPEDDQDDEETRRIRERMERAMADMEDSAESDNDDAANEQETDEESLLDPAAEELNDGFFDIHEMEEFADEEEDYLPQEAFPTPKPEDKREQSKKSFHQRQREGDIDSDSDEENPFGEYLNEEEPFVRRRKYREDDEIEALHAMYEDAETDDEDNVVNMTAMDLFGKPKKKYFDKWNAKQGKLAQSKDDDEDAESWDNHDFENDGPGWREENDGPGEGEAVDEHSENDGEGNDEDASERGPDETPDSNSLHTRKSEKLRQQTEQLEKDMLAEKPWQMTGEAKSTARPVNSLLEATPEFEVATKMAPLITVEHTENLEETIKRRILNEDWDDVIPRELPDVGWYKKRGELPEVSQEKSKLGLGELYEREYLKKAVGYDVDAKEKQTEEDKAKNEMKALFANLCSKLDALSNYHFAPRPISDEAEVRTVTTPAIAMEEVIPLHVSDARGVAPEEVYGKKRGRDGVLRGETELDQTERKRLRSAKKAARRKARKEKLADEKLISRLQPGLGLNNPYEKRKMREELSMARARGKVTTGEVDTDADYGASGTFFKRMQEQVERSIHGESDDGKQKKRNHAGSHGKKSSAFKL